MTDIVGPHILPLFDSGSADGHLFNVMPFVEGETLRARLPDGRSLLMQKPAGRSSREPTIVLNWPELVRRRAGVQR